MDVDDNVAVVGHYPFPIDRITAQFHDFPANMAPGHGNDFDRKREFAQYADHLGVIGNADEGLGNRGHDFFPGQRGTAAFDQFQAVVGFVSAVHIELQFSGTVKVVNRDAVAFQTLGGGLRAGNGAVKLGLEFREHVDEEIGRATSAHTDHALAIKTRSNVINGGFGDGFFQFVLVHHWLRLQIRLALPAL